MELCVPGDVLSSWNWLSTCDTAELSCCNMLSALWLLFQKRCFADVSGGSYHLVEFLMAVVAARQSWWVMCCGIALTEEVDGI